MTVPRKDNVHLNRVQGESDKQYEAFLMYYVMGEVGSIRALSEMRDANGDKYGTRRTLTRWQDKFDWEGRAKAARLFDSPASVDNLPEELDITKEEFAELTEPQRLFVVAFWSNDCNPHKACKIAGISHSTFRYWVRQYPHFAEMVQDVVDMQVAFAEGKLLSAVREDEPWAIKYFLDHKGGWGRKKGDSAPPVAGVNISISQTNINHNEKMVSDEDKKALAHTLQILKETGALENVIEYFSGGPAAIEDKSGEIIDAAFSEDDEVHPPQTDS